MKTGLVVWFQQRAVNWKVPEALKSSMYMVAQADTSFSRGAASHVWRSATLPWATPLAEAIKDRIGKAAFEIALKNGDIVEIITQAGHKPSRDWLNFVATSHARCPPPLVAAIRTMAA